mmetsp:Transcript_25891/g.46891  ORF Transcript_25891/g.46891 Transcript_25891/m.46891 type:complete len:496 (-) Transcript_25891:182-1669(-)|eukprot:CAMPEP_0198295112 /NCGR_PEP_ID=MMETSP1449-20131203/25942_1 /TAXON_ID=420275 /ORGANISM="Attheya septentrionalis, Strain CCMP2084" /LENGTH=495 /DNA_ID=CAMNT_0043995307 /DNA_START=42 /DNA_END=1529 /DNA_ORIENTATION=-
MAPYTPVFATALVLNVAVTVRSSGLWTKYFAPATMSGDDADPLLGGSTDKKQEEKKRHGDLLKRYLIVYLLATLSDWLQGPYVYALYAAYGYSQHDIAVLFVAGFGSSMVFGSFIGGMADMCGRRKFVVLFALIYAASCVTKHFNDFKILLLGRLLGGIATSLLFSVFEAWLIRSHADANVKSMLSASFSSASYGNSVIAIGAGLLANNIASSTEMTPMFSDVDKESAIMFKGGYLNPFDFALCALIFCGVGAVYLWEENYGDDQGQDDDNHGDEGKSSKWHDALKNALITTVRNRDIMLCGIISSLFEGSMYVFVFMWTPALQALTEEKDSLPFGLIFSTFMVSCMAGSSLFSLAIQKVKGEVLGVLVFAGASLAMLIATLSSSETIVFIMMNVFEMTVGMYWPIMGTMKGAIVPENKRAAIYNLFRIPLNFIVLFSLLTKLTPTQSLTLVSAMLGIASVLQFQLMKRRGGITSSVEVSPREDTDIVLPAIDAI